MAQGSFVANGNIPMSRFVKPDTTAVGKAIVATAGSGTEGDSTYGVSHESSRNIPYSTLDDGYTAIAGENVRVYIDDEECYLESGAAVAHGDKLKSDSVGRGIPATTDKDRFGAIALQACSAAGVLIRVKVVKSGYLSV